MLKNKLLLLIMIFAFNVKSSSAVNGDTLIVNPNPFDSIAVIHFQIADNDTVSLHVYSAWGQIIKTYFNNTVLPSGSYTFNFNGDTLPNGIYFVHLKIGSTQTLISKLIKVDKLAGLNEYLLEQQPLMYPNPTASVLNIVNEQNVYKSAIIEIENNLGQVLLSQTFNGKQHQLQLQNLAAGIYFVKVSYSNGMNVTKKIIKQ